MLEQITLEKIQQLKLQGMLEGLKHMGTAIVPAIYDPSAIDETVFVGTEEAELRVRALAREQGLFVGWSTGAALVAAECNGHCHHP